MKSKIEITVDLDDNGAPTIDGGLVLGDDSDLAKEMLTGLHPVVRDAIEEWLQWVVGDQYIKATGNSEEECKAGIKLQEDIARAGREPEEQFVEGDPNNYGDSH